MNSSFKIKNPNFNTDLKNMIKIVRIDTGWQWPSLGTTAFKKFKDRHSQRRLLHLKFMEEVKAVVGNDGH